MVSVSDKWKKISSDPQNVGRVSVTGLELKPNCWSDCLWTRFRFFRGEGQRFGSRPWLQGHLAAATLSSNKSRPAPKQNQDLLLVCSLSVWGPMINPPTSAGTNHDGWEAGLHTSSTSIKRHVGLVLYWVGYTFTGRMKDRLYLQGPSRDAAKSSCQVASRSRGSAQAKIKALRFSRSSRFFVLNISL